MDDCLRPKNIDDYLRPNPLLVQLGMVSTTPTSNQQPPTDPPKAQSTDRQTGASPAQLPMKASTPPRSFPQQNNSFRPMQAQPQAQPYFHGHQRNHGHQMRPSSPPRGFFHQSIPQTPMHQQSHAPQPYFHDPQGYHGYQMNGSSPPRTSFHQSNLMPQTQFNGVAPAHRPSGAPQPSFQGHQGYPGYQTSASLPPRGFFQQGNPLPQPQFPGVSQAQQPFTVHPPAFQQQSSRAEPLATIPNCHGNKALHGVINALMDQLSSTRFATTVRPLQDLVNQGATWEHCCDALVEDNRNHDETPSCMQRRRRLGPAIRFVVNFWVDERKRGVQLTQISRVELERGLKATKTYLTEHKASKKTVCYHTICLVGSSTAGKTSLITSIIDERAYKVTTDARTIGIDHVTFELDGPSQESATMHKRRTITFSDFSGQNAYRGMHALFFTRHTLFLICVDLEAYSIALLKCEILTTDAKQLQHLMNEYVDRHVLHWIRIILARRPDAEFVFVCTKEDTISSGPGVDKFEVVEHVRKMLGRVMVIVADIRREYNPVQEWDDKTPRANRVAHLWDPSLAKYEATNLKMLMTSSTTTTAVLQARRELVKLIVEGNSSYEMPEKYILVRDAVMGMRLSAATETPALRIENLFMKVNELITKLQRSVRGLDDKTAAHILRSLRDRGDILWFEEINDKKLKRTVIVDPGLLIDFLREIVNHKHPKGRLPHGQLSHAPYWMELHNDTESMLAFKGLLEQFHLVLPVCGEMLFDSDLIVPAYWKTNPHAVWIFGGDDLRLSSRGPWDEAISYRILWEFRVAPYLPDTLFDSIIVATYAHAIPLKIPTTSCTEMPTELRVVS